MVNLQITPKIPTIGEMVAGDYRKAEIFRKYGIDYCCGGKKSLEEVCQKKSLNTAVIREELDEIDLRPEKQEQDFETWPPEILADYILEHHHRYVNEAIPVLLELAMKVGRVHGEKHPELIHIALNFNSIAKELQHHMHKEEQVLFPYITKMATAKITGKRLSPPFFVSVENPIRMMENEHESAGNIMATIRVLSNDYSTPEGACTSYKVLFAKLVEFEADLHEHIHLENNILFPKALALENALTIL